MPLDPIDGKIVNAGTQSDRFAAEIGDLKRRVTNLEHSRPGMQIVAGTPSGSPRDGTPVGDTTNVRLWLRLNGTWRWVALT